MLRSLTTKPPPVDTTKVETITERIAAAGREACRMDLEFWRPQLVAFEKCQVEPWLIAIAKHNIARCEAHLADKTVATAVAGEMAMIARDDIETPVETPSTWTLTCDVCGAAVPDGTPEFPRIDFRIDHALHRLLVARAQVEIHLHP